LIERYFGFPEDICNYLEGSLEAVVKEDEASTIRTLKDS
jgi:hypothetical protein